MTCRVYPSKRAGVLCLFQGSRIENDTGCARTTLNSPASPTLIIAHTWYAHRIGIRLYVQPTRSSQYFMCPNAVRLTDTLNQSDFDAIENDSGHGPAHE